MSYYEDGAIDQFKLPVAYAFGQETIETLLVEGFEAWAKRRQVLCGHQTPTGKCRMCVGTIKVNEAFLQGQPGVRVFPQR